MSLNSETLEFVDNEMQVRHLLGENKEMQERIRNFVERRIGDNREMKRLRGLNSELATANIDIAAENAAKSSALEKANQTNRVQRELILKYEARQTRFARLWDWVVRSFRWMSS